MKFKVIILICLSIFIIMLFLTSNSREKKELSIEYFESKNGVFSEEYPSWISNSPTFIKKLLESLVGPSQSKLFFMDSDIEDMNQLKNISDLSDLDLSETRIKDFSVIRELKDLKHLFLNSTSIKDLKPILKLTQLEELNLSNTNIIDLEGIEMNV